MHNRRPYFCLVGLLLSIIACGDNDDVGDAGQPPADAGSTADAGLAGARIEDLRIDEEMPLPGLTAPVEVITDDHGIPHVYAENLEDLGRAVGYRLAQDRMAEMDTARRWAKGEQAEVFPGGGIYAQDVYSRTMGFRRMAEASVAAMDSESRALLESFSAGVNAYIAKVRRGDKLLPGYLHTLLRASAMPDWTPIDSVALFLRVHADGNDYSDWDIVTAQMKAKIAREFPSSSPDSRLAKRANILHDLFYFAPAEAVFALDDFPNQTSDSGTRALWEPDPRPWYGPRPSRRLLSQARAAVERLRSQGMYDTAGGSNAWAVHGSKTASGHAILAADPHSRLVSPGHWFAHVNTRRAGGDIEAFGAMGATVPLPFLGFTNDIAWGATHSYFDAADTYYERVRSSTSGPDTVELNGQQVEIETVSEVIQTLTGTSAVTIETVPHHGPILPGARTATEAISIRWTGHEPVDYVRVALDLVRAQGIAEVEDALDHRSAESSNIIVATRDGEVFWTTQTEIPIRDPRALLFDEETWVGHNPCTILPGTGEYEWIGTLSDRYLPHELNPDRGFVASSNNDPLGVSADGNPFNDAHYLGCWFMPGYRFSRIMSKLEALTARGGVTTAEMMALQSDHFDPLAAKLASALVAAVDRAAEERASAGTHPDLTAVVLDAGNRFDRLVSMRNRLAAWTSFDTPAAVGGAPSSNQIADSIATTIFAVTFPRLMMLTLDDETKRIGARASSTWQTKTMQFALLSPRSLTTYDQTRGDTVLWDDLSTPAVEETKDERILRAMLSALDFLELTLGSDMNQWRWGRLNLARMESIWTSRDEYSIPPPTDLLYPSGFPRPGAQFSLDPAIRSFTSTEAFAATHAARLRLVVEMAADGPKATLAVAGGQDLDPASRHHADGAEHWRKNELPRVAFMEADVVRKAESRVRYLP